MISTLKRRIFFCALIIICLLQYACANGQNRARNIDTLFEALQLHEGTWVADIGSREGFFTIRMAPKVGKSGHVFAVDIDHTALEDLHQNLDEHDISNVTPVYSISDNPMLPSGVLDAVLIRNTYHEFNAPLSMLSHIKRALKAGGRLVIAEPISDNLLDDSREQQARNHDIAVKYVKEDLAQAGFKVIQEMEQYSVNNRGTRMWLLVAQP